MVLDVSGSMNTAFSFERSRYTVAQNFFESFINKLIAHQFEHAVGLVRFGELIRSSPIIQEYLVLFLPCKLFQL